VDRFEERFRRLESGIRRDGHDVHALSAAELDRRWEQAKRELRGPAAGRDGDADGRLEGLDTKG
jgi:hypothetical protein